MTHALYRALIISTALVAVAAAVLALSERWTWAVALLALAVAQVPALMHLQTRRFVRVSSTVGSRVNRHVGSEIRAPRPSLTQDLARMQEILERLEASMPAATVQDVTASAAPADAPAATVQEAPAPTVPATVPAAPEVVATPEGSRVPTAPTTAAQARPAAAAPADQDVHATVNEFRRELRMTRLVVSELLRSQDDPGASPDSGASGAPLR